MRAVIKGLSVCIVLLMFVGCQSPTGYNNVILPDEDDRMGGTGLESQDVRTAARKMAGSLLRVPALQGDGTDVPTVAISPMTNNTRFIIDQNIFTKKIRIDLNRNTYGRMRFLARERIHEVMKERSNKRNGMVSSSKDAALLGVDFFLTGDISGISKAGGGRASDYMLLSFQLIDAETSEIVWEDAYEVKKTGEMGVVYQ